MENSLRILLFTPSPRWKEIAKLEGHEVFNVDTIEEAEEIIGDDRQYFDIALVPSKLIGDNDGYALCNLISKRDLFKKTVTILLDEELNQDYPLSGADFIIKPQELQFQVNKICALKEKFFRAQAKNELPCNFNILNCSTTGVLLFDPIKGLIYVNTYGANLLRLSIPIKDAELIEIAKQFRGILQEYVSLYKQKNSQSEGYIIKRELDVRRLDLYAFKAACTVSSVLDEKNQIKYLAISLTSVSNIHYLSSRLIQAQQLGSAFLNACSACVLPYMKENRTLSIIKLLKGFQNNLPNNSEIYPCVTFLVDVMELILPKDKRFKIDIDKNYLVQIKVSDFIQILGLILMYISERTCQNGTIKINTSSYIPGEGIYLTVIAESLDKSYPPSEEVVSRLINEDFSDILSVEDVIEKTSLGLTAAQTVAERYGIAIEYQNAGSLIKARFRLPILPNTSSTEGNNS